MILKLLLPNLETERTIIVLSNCYLKTIKDSRIWSIICNRPKYRFSFPIYFTKCHEQVAGALQNM